jgi:orotate phosphoribosyltransferase
VTVRDTLLAGLREHALVIGDVTLASGRKASYYVDARRALLLPGPFRALGELVAAQARDLGATAVGGPATAAIPVACAAVGMAPDAALKGFFVRKERKQHGLQRAVEGPSIGPGDRALVVEDVVTTGGSLIDAIERLREAQVQIAGALAVVDRLAGGAEAIGQALGDPSLPYRPLFTIDDLYPERPDREPASPDTD